MIQFDRNTFVSDDLDYILWIICSNFSKNMAIQGTYRNHTFLKSTIIAMLSQDDHHDLVSNVSNQVLIKYLNKHPSL